MTSNSGQPKIYVAGHRGMVDLHTQHMLSHINVGYGCGVRIKELAEAIGKTVGYQGQIWFDPGKPDGALRKLMDSSRLHAPGWQSKVGLTEGLALAYEEFLKIATPRT